MKLAARRRLKRLGTVGKRPQGEVAQDGDGQNGEKEEYTHDGDIYTNSPVTGMEKRPVRNVIPHGPHCSGSRFGVAAAQPLRAGFFRVSRKIAEFSL